MEKCLIHNILLSELAPTGTQKD